MKNFLCRAVLVGLIAVSARAFGGTPVAVSLLGTLPERADVYGLHFSFVSIGPISSNPNSVAGLSLGCIQTGVGDGVMSGIQVSGILAGGECVYGLQAGGIFAMAEKATGIELAGGVSMCRDFRGAQLAGLLSQAESCCGLQLAFYNGSASMCGVQVGVMNFAVPANDGWVVQLGLVNGIGKDEKSSWTEGIRYLPIVNAGW